MKPVAERERLSAGERMVLKAIRDVVAQGGIPNIHELAAALHRSPGEIQGLLASARRKGLIHPAGKDAIEIPDDDGSVLIIARGIPRTQGSKRNIVNRSGRVSMLESGRENHAFWRQIIYEAALASGPPEPFDGPVKIDLTFYLRRPKNPKYEVPHRFPDGDKLMRAILDALVNAAVMIDDGQMSDWTGCKRWADDGQPRAEILVTPWDGQP